MKDPFTVMPRPTAVMFTLLQSRPLLKDFILIGGTGLALHIGHRWSEDLDFITLLPKLPRAALILVEDAIRHEGHTLVHQDNPAALDDFENAAMDLRDHSQNWVIDGIVKMTFFAGDDHHKRVLTGPVAGNGFRIGSLEELSRLKALVSASRSKSRDWFDLFILERDHGFGLAQWKEAYDKAGLTSAHFETALNRICSGIVSPDDEGFKGLVDGAPALDEITAGFRALRATYEMDLAKAALSETRQRHDRPTSGKNAV